MDITANAGGAGSFSFDDSSSPALTPTGRGRVRSADFGLPERQGLIDLARTYLDAQARLWPELAGTPVVPVADAATVAAMADELERRFRSQTAEPFQPADSPRMWTDLGVPYLRFSDENSNPRSLDQQLVNVLNRARRDGVFVPWRYVLADAAVSGTLACRTGYTLAKTIVERRNEFGVSWFLIDDLSRMSRNTIESLRLGELAAETGVRVVGASAGFDSANPQSSLLLPVLGSMNEAFITQLRSKVKRGMDDAFRRGDNIQPPGVGYRLVDLKDAAGNLVITHKNTIEKVVEIDPEAAEWTRRGAEMIAYEGKSAVDVARLFNEHKVGGKQTWSDSRVRQHFGREKLIGQDVFRKTRQVTDRQTGKKKVIQLPASEWIWRDVPHLRILTDKLAEAERERLKELQRAGRRPRVKSVRETDVRAALGNLRELLQADVGIAAQVLKALVGDVVVEAHKVEGKARPEMVARFTINAIPAMALLNRGQAAKTDDPTVTMWEFLHGDRWTMPSEEGFRGLVVAVPLRKPPKYEVLLPQIVEMAEAGAGVDLISRALGVGAEVVRDALHLHRTGKRPPGRVDGRSRQPRQPGKPFVPKYQQIAAEVDRRRKAGEGFDRLAREMKVSRPTVVRAYDFANRDEAAAAAREGRTPTRPPYRWSEESRATKRKPRDA